jgi:hypothetical protein
MPSPRRCNGEKLSTLQAHWAFLASESAGACGKTVRANYINSLMYVWCREGASRASNPQDPKVGGF